MRRADGQGTVGHQRRGDGRTVDQGQHLLLARRELRQQRAEQPGEGQDLAGAHRTGAGYRRQGPGQHRRHRLRELGPHGGVAVEEVGEPGQHHQARHPLGERCPGIGLHRRGWPPGVAQALLRRQADRGVLAIARGDAVDGDPRVRDQPLERGAARRHPLQRFGCHLDRGTQPAHAFGGGERDVVAAAQDRVQGRAPG